MGYAEQDFQVEDLFDLVFPKDMGVCGHLAMIFYGYQEKVIVSGSFIGGKDTWAAFRTRWKAKLREHGICYYKTSEWRGLRDEFRRFKSVKDYPPPSGREAADKVRDELEHIVNTAKIGGIGAVIPVPVFNEVAAMPEFKERLERLKPYQLALYLVFLYSVEQINTVPGHHKIAFVHDEGDDCAFIEASYFAFKKTNPKTAKYMAGISCLDDKTHPPLQCADMVANTVCNFAQEWQKSPTDTTLKRLRKSILQIRVWEKDSLVSILRKQRW